MSYGTSTEILAWQTLFEIASVVGTPLLLGVSTQNRVFGHFARILVDMNLSRHNFYEIMAEREQYVFNVKVVYECREQIPCSD